PMRSVQSSGWTGGPRRWEASGPAGISSEDALRPEEEHGDEREESDCGRDRRIQENLSHVEDDAQGEAADKASPHLARATEHDDDVADRRGQGTHVRVDARGEQDLYERAD